MIRRKGSSGSKRLGALSVLALLAVLSACQDLLVEPAPPSPAVVHLSLGPPASAAEAVGPGNLDAEVEGSSAQGLGAAFDRADAVRIRLLRGGTVVTDVSQDFAPEGSEARIQVEVELEGEQETLQLQVTLTWQGQALFEAERAVTLGSGETTEAEVSLQPLPAGIEVTDGPVLLEALGEQAQLSGAVVLATGDPIPGLAPIWSTDDPQVVSVSPAGVVTAEAEGEARVTATHQTLSGAVVVEVRQVVASVAVAPDRVELGVDETVHLQASLQDRNGNPIPAGVRNLTWTSSDPDVATVAAAADDRGLVQGMDEGEATITATADGVSGSAVVTVVALQIETVEVTPASAGLRLGQTAQLTATARNADGEEVEVEAFEWTSSDPGVATVDGNGLVTARGPGETTVSAAVEGVSGTASVSVSSNLVVNGSFENGDASGWTVTNAGSGDFFIMFGTTAPLSGLTVPPPPDGTFAAVTDQTGPGMHILHQDVTIPAGASAEFRAIIYVENRAQDYVIGQGLDHTGGPNQQFRVDIMEPGAAVDDVGGGVLMNVFQTLPGDPTSIPHRMITADLSQFAGGTVRIRFAEVDNQLFFNAGVDAVEVVVSGAEASARVESSVPLAVPGVKRFRLLRPEEGSMKAYGHPKSGTSGPP